MTLYVQVHYRHVWNRYDDIMLLLFSATFICWGALVVYVVDHDEIGLERPLWRQYDPQLIGELIFAVANLLAIIRLLFFFQITQAIGPLQVALPVSPVELICVMPVLYSSWVYVYCVGFNCFVIQLHCLKSP